MISPREYKKQNCKDRAQICHEDGTEQSKDNNSYIDIEISSYLRHIGIDKNIYDIFMKIYDYYTKYEYDGWQRITDIQELRQWFYSMSLSEFKSLLVLLSLER